MRPNVQTQVAPSPNVLATLLDIAVEKSGTADKETRFDVQVHDAGPGYVVLKSRKNGTKIYVAPDLAQATAPQLLRAVGAEALVAFAHHQPAQIGGQTYYSLAQYQASLAPAYMVPVAGTPLAVTRVSPELRARIGFLPGVAIVVSGRR